MIVLAKNPWNAGYGRSTRHCDECCGPITNSPLLQLPLVCCMVAAVVDALVVTRISADKTKAGRKHAPTT